MAASKTATAPASNTAAKKAAAMGATDGPLWTGHPSPEAFTKMQDERLGRAKEGVERLRNRRNLHAREAGSTPGRTPRSRAIAPA